MYWTGENSCLNGRKGEVWGEACEPHLKLNWTFWLYQRVYCKCYTNDLWNKSHLYKWTRNIMQLIVLSNIVEKFWFCPSSLHTHSRDQPAAALDTLGGQASTQVGGDSKEKAFFVISLSLNPFFCLLLPLIFPFHTKPLIPVLLFIFHPWPSCQGVPPHPLLHQRDQQQQHCHLRCPGIYTARSQDDTLAWAGHYYITFESISYHQ